MTVHLAVVPRRGRRGCNGTGAGRSLIGLARHDAANLNPELLSDHDRVWKIDSEPVQGQSSSTSELLIIRRCPYAITELSQKQRRNP
jgi:hypothetical protein